MNFFLLVWAYFISSPMESGLGTAKMLCYFSSLFIPLQCTLLQCSIVFVRCSIVTPLWIIVTTNQGTEISGSHWRCPASEVLLTLLVYCVSFSSSYLDGIECQSRCELEVDAVATDVLNREEVTDNIGGNPGLAALWEDERQRRIQAGKPTGDLEPPSSPGKIYRLYFSFNS